MFEHTVTYALDGILTGSIYSFRFKSFNIKGESAYSEVISVACTSPPPKANSPTVNYLYSTRSSIFVEWMLTPDGLGEGGRITGYKLYLDNGRGGEFLSVIDTVGYSAQIRQHLAVNLTEGLEYRF